MPTSSWIGRTPTLWYAADHNSVVRRDRDLELVTQPLAPLARRGAFGASEPPRQMTLIDDPASRGDFRQGQARQSQQFLGALDTPAHQPAGRGARGRPAERA